MKESKKVISANVDESTAKLLKKLSDNSSPHLNKSAIVDYAIKTVDLTNYIEEANDGSEENKTRNENTKKAKKIN